MVHPLVIKPATAEGDAPSADDRALEHRLIEWFRGYGSALIGFSGGVDSAYLACVAVDALGHDRVLAVIGRSASYPAEQWERARSVARDFDVPVFATPMTAGLIAARLREHDLGREVDLRTFRPRERWDLGPFTIDPIHVTHSIVDAVALAITTPLGVVVHSGDFKIDHTPIDGRPPDIQALADYGSRGPSRWPHPSPAARHRTDTRTGPRIPAPRRGPAEGLDAPGTRRGRDVRALRRRAS